MGKNVRMANDVELKLIVKVIADGLLLGSQLTKGLSIEEVNTLVASAKDVGALLAMPIGMVIPEFLALDEAARADLIAYVGENVKFPANVIVEAVVQKALDVAIAISAAFNIIVPV